MKEAVKSKKVFTRTFGCQMNVRDSEVICGLLKNEGYEFTEEANMADIVLFNTCSVRQHAEDKVWSEIGRVAKMCSLPPRFRADDARNLNRGDTSPRTRKKIIGLVGCMAQNYKETIFERAPNVDFVVGPSDIHKIPDIIKKLSAKRYPCLHGRQAPNAKNKDLFELKIFETDGSIRPEEIYHTGFYEDKEHAYVVISEGCSNFCSYCVVPYVRGQLHNRNYKDILKEIEEAVDAGITKITLLGQNVNAYSSPACPAGRQLTAHSSRVDFIELLKLINDIKDLKELSFITSHPKDTSIELFKAMADLEKLKKYLHLPVQSGSDRILQLMNRGYTRKFYLDLINNYRRIVKEAVLTTDIIVGFPTEKEEDFKDSYNLVHDIGFDAAYIFKYSPRPQTQAENFVDDVAKEEKERRHKLILDLQKSISKKFK